jgi:hypothetical protein
MKDHLAGTLLMEQKRFKLIGWLDECRRTAEMQNYPTHGLRWRGRSISAKAISTLSGLRKPNLFEKELG